MVKLLHQLLEGVFKIKKYDLAIIGSGPVGIFAANYAQLHGLKSVLFDSLPEVGGQPQMLYPFKQITDIPVFNQIRASKLVRQLISNLNTQTDVLTNHSVKTVNKNKDGFLVDSEFQVKSIIIATGNGAFNPKKLPLTTDDQIEKRIHYFIKNPNLFNNQKIAVFGGGDSALDWALELAANANSQITLIHRRNNFRGLESSVKKLKELKNVQILTPYLPKKLDLIDNQLLVSLKKVGGDQLEQFTFDQIVVAYGFKANNRFVRKWGITLKGAHIEVDRSMRTNVPGIFAIGDVATYPGRVPLIGVGFGEAQIAITTIMRDLFPEKTLTIHSTSM